MIGLKNGSCIRRKYYMELMRLTLWHYGIQTLGKTKSSIWAQSSEGENTRNRERKMGMGDE
jgi:hypothetical protein